MQRFLFSTLMIGLATLAIAAGGDASTAAEPPAAPTDPTARAEWLSSQAETAFSEKRYADAIRLYLDAWEAAPAASILYNVAFIYDRRLNDAELAIDYYQRAAGAPGADPELVAKARARILALKRPPDEKPPDRPTPPKPAPRSRGAIGPWLVTAAGGAVLLGGGVMGLVASGTQSDFAQATTSADKRRFQRAGRAQALVADILMGAGVAALGVGLVWLVLEPSAEEGRGEVNPVEGAGLRLEPRLIPGGGALVLGGPL